MMHDLIVDLSLQAFMLVYSCIFSSFYKRFTIVVILFVSFSPQECNVRMLTNARLYKKKQPDAPENGMINVILSRLHLLSVWGPSCGHLAYWLGPTISIRLDLIFILQIFVQSELPLITSLFSLGISEGDALMVERYWSRWMDAAESLLWLDTNVR